jgi:hypothetical protein
MAFLHHYVGDLGIPSILLIHLPVREKVCVMAFLHFHEGNQDIPYDPGGSPAISDLDIPLILRVHLLVGKNLVGWCFCTTMKVIRTSPTILVDHLPEGKRRELWHLSITTSVIWISCGSICW